MITSGNYGRLLRQAVIETLEGMAFLEVLPEEAEPDSLEAGVLWLHTTIELLSPVCGRLTLLWPERLGASITENVYGGCGAQPGRQEMLDTLAEITNTAAGRFLGSAAGEGELFSLGLPGAAEGRPETRGADCCCFSTDDGDWLAVYLVLNDETGR